MRQNFIFEDKNIGIHAIMKAWNKVFLLFLFGLFTTQTSVAEPVKSPTPFKRQPLINRDPCSDPKLYYCAEFVDAQVGKYLFKIPFNLIKEFPTDYTFMELMPEWPSMEGVTKNDQGEIFDVIRIIVNTIRSAKPTEKGISHYIQRDGLKPNLIPNLGLIEYRQPKLNNVPLAYVPLDQSNLLPNNQPLYITRSNIPVGKFSHAVPNPNKEGVEGTYICSFGYTLREGVYVSVEFYNRHLKDWKAITLSVRNFLESSIQGHKSQLIGRNRP